jgi:hypothetical protein
MDTWHASAGGVFVCRSPFTEVSTVARTLAEHPAFWTSSESHFLYRLYGSRAGLERPFLCDLYCTCNEDGAWLRANAISCPEFLAALGEGIGKLFQARAGRKRWVDNSPENALLLDELLHMFPDASFVGLLQPACTAMFIEMARRAGMTEQKLHDLTALNALYSERPTKAACVAPDRIYLLEESELFANPGIALGAMLDFLGEANNEAVPAAFSRRLLQLDVPLAEARVALARFEKIFPSSAAS